MKLNGQTVSGVYVETVIIPRPSIVRQQTGPDGQPVVGFDGKPVMEEVPQYHVFKFGAILDYDDFDKMVPAPPVPKMMLPGGTVRENPESKEYKEAIAKWSELRWYWAMLKSMSATPGLEWEKVDMEKPETWHLYEKELREAGFSANELGRLARGFSTANSIDEQKMEEARKHFLQAGRGQ